MKHPESVMLAKILGIEVRCASCVFFDRLGECLLINKAITEQPTFRARPPHCEYFLLPNPPRQ